MDLMKLHTRFSDQPPHYVMSQKWVSSYLQNGTGGQAGRQAGGSPSTGRRLVQRSSSGPPLAAAFLSSRSARSPASHSLGAAYSARRTACNSDKIRGLHTQRTHEHNISCVKYARNPLTGTCKGT